MAGFRYFAKGTKFGKAELVGHSGGMYNFVCDCGDHFSRSITKCHDEKQYHAIRCRCANPQSTNVNTSRPYTDDEAQMIKDFEDGSK